PHGALVDPQVKWMLFTDHRLPEYRHRKRNVGLLKEFEQFLLQSEAMNLDISQNDWLWSPINHFPRFGERGAQRFRIAALVEVCRLVANARCPHEVAWQLDIDGSFKTQSRVQHAIDFLKSSLRIAQDSRGNRELLEYLLLRI